MALAPMAPNVSPQMSRAAAMATNVSPQISRAADDDLSDGSDLSTEDESIAIGVAKKMRRASPEVEEIAREQASHDAAEHRAGGALVATDGGSIGKTVARRRGTGGIAVRRSDGSRRGFPLPRPAGRSPRSKLLSPPRPAPRARRAT